MLGTSFECIYTFIQTQFQQTKKGQEYFLLTPSLCSEKNIRDRNPDKTKNIQTHPPKEMFLKNR